MTTIRKKVHLCAAGFVLLVSMLLMTSGQFFADPVTTTDTTTVQTPTVTTPETPVKKSKRANTWVEKKGYMYYYNDLGKKSTGKTKIGKRTYLFDNKGRQKVGWQKIGKSYYFFQIKKGKYGYMVKNKAINHIPLRGNGKASVTSGNRIALLWRCSQIVEAHTKPTWDKATKMRTIWNWMQSNIGYWNVIYHHQAGWDVYYASLCLFSSKPGGSCEGLGCLWAFLANACGAKNCYSVASGGHGWAEVEGLVYDPACARYMRHPGDYYACPYSLSGVNGRPRYAGNGIYREQV